MLDWLERWNAAMDYVEEHLEGKLDYGMAARKACCSEYLFLRMFSFLASCPLSEYVRRRRMTLAACGLQRGERVLDVALRYGYESPEAFARAFQQFHGIAPSAAKRPGATLRSCPRLSFQITIKGDTEMNYRIEEKPAFQVYGIERIFDSKNEEQLKEIPAFWGELLTSGAYDELLASSQGMCGVNAVCGYRETGGTTFPYMLCVAKTPLSRTEGYTVVDVPASTWAVFRNEPHSMEETSDAMQRLTARSFTDWLPAADYEVVPGLDFEIYYSSQKGCYEESWMRVTPK